MSIEHVTEDDYMLSIGEVSVWLGKTPKTLRIWDKNGKLKATRTPSNHRQWRRADVEAVAKGKSPYER